MTLGTHAPDTVSDYREFPPPFELKGYLLCMWTQSIRGAKDTYFHRVLPDGCIDIVLIDDEPPQVAGPWTESFIARFTAGTTIVGARFHPGLAPAVLGLPASAMLNQSLPLSAVWRRPVCSRFERISEKRSLSARVSAMESALLDRLTQAAPVDQVMTSAIQWLARHPHGRIEELGQRIGFSTRQLQRRFTIAVGYGPKMFQSVLRFQRLLNLSVRTSVPRNLAQFSADVGYADQAHMTREVRRFSGTAPTALLPAARCALALSDLVRKAGHQGC
jgi:AraC-like DNA-binding protein